VKASPSALRGHDCKLLKRLQLSAQTSVLLLSCCQLMEP